MKMAIKCNFICGAHYTVTLAKAVIATRCGVNKDSTMFVMFSWNISESTKPCKVLLKVKIIC